MTVISGAKDLFEVITKENPGEFDRLFEHERVAAFFMADWCGPCKMMMSNLKGDELFKPFLERNRITGIYVDVDTAGEIATRFRIKSIPATMIWNKQELYNSYFGAKESRQIRGYLKNAYGLLEEVPAMRNHLSAGILASA